MKKAPPGNSPEISLATDQVKIDGLLTLALTVSRLACTARRRMLPVIFSGRTW